MAELDIPDNVYNWLFSYFGGHSQCTKYDNLTSAFQEILAGIIQGSGIGPDSFVVNSGDMKHGHNFQGQKVKRQGHQAGFLTAAFTHRRLQQLAQSGNVLSVGNCCYVAVR